ncbi:Vacuolar cation/proton exchanger 1 [Apostasia shenzhenica]|uniref:Vacuolar cation/proton exchanger 1 n=1 Tax=Apostasia shenzhenica TaxID=1088818 RepID=A0A2I0A588_9ASPA|nr:Vacuolar cation/proton exchanger 1 [Apostasia shenzhenica]
MAELSIPRGDGCACHLFDELPLKRSGVEVAMSSAGHSAPYCLEAGLIDAGNVSPRLSMEMHYGQGRTAHSMSSSSLRKRSDLSLVSKVQCRFLRDLLANLQEIFFGTKLFVLFVAVPLAIIAQSCGFGRPCEVCDGVADEEGIVGPEFQSPVSSLSLSHRLLFAWVFALSLLGLIPLAERVSFLTEQLAFHTGRTVGGLLNATCGNATELIIAMFALRKGKIRVVKLSLVGSVLSNLLLVLGTSLFCGGIVNLQKEQPFDRKHAEVNIALLLLGALCHILTTLFKYSVNSSKLFGSPSPTTDLSRACSIVMLVAYFAYLFFQLKTNRQLFDSDSQEKDDDDDGVVADNEAVFGFPSATVWLIAMTIVIAVLSENVVGTIEVHDFSSLCFHVGILGQSLTSNMWY